MRFSRRTAAPFDGACARAPCTAPMTANPSTAPREPHGAIAGVTRRCIARPPRSSKQPPKGAGGRPAAGARPGAQLPGARWGDGHGPCPSPYFRNGFWVRDRGYHELGGIGRGRPDHSIPCSWSKCLPPWPGASVHTAWRRIRPGRSGPNSRHHLRRRHSLIRRAAGGASWPRDARWPASRSRWRAERPW